MTVKKSTPRPKRDAETQARISAAGVAARKKQAEARRARLGEAQAKLHPKSPGTKGGRAPGTKTRYRRLTDDQRQALAALADGITPLQFCCSVLRDEKASFADKKWAAHELMPYMHRKMPVAVDNGQGGPIGVMSYKPEQLAQLTEDELGKLELILMRLNTVGLGDETAAGVAAGVAASVALQESAGDDA